jgi:cobalt-zinc-cadmium efflux system outer membrane protein
VLKSAGFCIVFVTLVFQSSASAQLPSNDPRASGEILRLSRQQAVDESLRRNFGLAAAREQVEQARAQVVVAAAFPDPSFAADIVETTPLNPRTAVGDDEGVAVTIPFPGKTGLRRAVASAGLSAAELNLTQLRQQVASQAVQAYDAILVAMQHRDDLVTSKELAEDFLRKTQARFMAGTVPKVDVVKAEVDVAQAENDLIANERASATARASLNRLLGRVGGAPLEVTDSLTLPRSLAAIENLEKLAEASRPELQSLVRQLEGARAATRLAGRFWAPDVSVSFTRNGVQGSPAQFTSGISFGVPVLFWQHQRGEIAAAQHRETELAATNDIRSQISLDVQSGFANASIALRQAIFIRDHLLPEAREVFRIASASYGLGGSSALDLLDAKRTLLDAERQYADALGAANDAEAALELAIGTSLPIVNPGDHS